jgi:hypothetical protein
MFVHWREGSRQILQCVGQIRTGSLVQTLNQTSDLRRHGKLHGAMPTLHLSPSSRSQFSGASWIGSHLLGMESSHVLSASCRLPALSRPMSKTALLESDCSGRTCPSADCSFSDRRSQHAVRRQRIVQLGSAFDERRDTPFEAADLPDGFVSLGPRRKAFRGFPQARQQLYEFVQFSFGYSNCALAHAVASSLE